MNRYGIQPGLPGLRGGQGGFVERIGDHGGGWPDGLSWAILALLLVLVLIAIASLALDLYRRSQPATGRTPQPATGTLAVLDLRYARGEIGRDAYLQARSDLGGAEATTVVLPAQPEPPPEPADRPES